MLYDAITQTQRSIRNWQIQFKLFLKKNHEHVLPSIGRNSLGDHYKQLQQALRSRQKSLCYSPQPFHRKQLNTISIQDTGNQRINQYILKPKFDKHTTKIKLPRFQKKSLSKRQNKSPNHSFQYIQSQLVEQTADILQGNDSNIKNISVMMIPKNKKLAYDLKSSRYLAKAKSVQKQQIKTLKIQVQNIKFDRQSCYSPWDMYQDGQLFPAVSEFQSR